MTIYDVLIYRLNKNCRQEEKWVKGIKANNLTEASKIALEQNKEQGYTNMSMGWSVYQANPRTSI